MSSRSDKKSQRPPGYIEYSNHDVYCVVHAINNAIGHHAIDPSEVKAAIKSKYYDPRIGFDPVPVIDYAESEGYHFKLVPHYTRYGSYIIGIHKPSYNHFLAMRNGIFYDDEGKIMKEIPGIDKIEQIYQYVE
jgi:hypothetical protein